MYRVIIAVIVAVVLLIVGVPIVSACPTCLNLMPTATMQDANTLSLQYENDGYTGLFTNGADNLYMIQAGINPRLEAGVDFIRSGGETDTILNAKYLLLTENEKRPALAIGTVGIGKGFSPSYYLAAAKGAGTCRVHLGAIGDRHQSALMAGFEVPASDSVTLMADYIGGDEGYAAVGASWSGDKGPCVTVAYGFANESANSDLLYVNVAWELKLGK